MSTFQKYKAIIIGIICILILAILSCFGYIWYKKSTTVILPPEQIQVTTQSQNETLVCCQWLSAYLSQYQQRFLDKEKTVLQYTIDDIIELEEHILQVKVTLEMKHPTSDFAQQLNGGLIDDHTIQCDWVLYFTTFSSEESKTIYRVTRLVRPAVYDMEQYKESGQQEKDEYQQEYIDTIPFEKRQYTYKIENDCCSVSYDYGETWIEVPLSLEELCTIGDGNSYYNRLQDGSYGITPEKTYFLFGGTNDTTLSVIYSDDQGHHWHTSIVDDTTNVEQKINSVRIKFICFPTPQTGYTVVSSGRTMSQEGQTIFQTTDGGQHWKKMGYGPSTWLMQYAGFINETVGFISYPSVSGEESNFYRTEDGGKTFSAVSLPIIEVEVGNTDNKITPFTQPETPFWQDGKLYLYVNQGDMGDYNGGRCKAVLISEDMGKTWSYTNRLIEIEEPSIG